MLPVDLARCEAGLAGTDQAQVGGLLPGVPQGGRSSKSTSNNVDGFATDNNFESDKNTGPYRSPRGINN